MDVLGDGVELGVSVRFGRGEEREELLGKWTDDGRGRR